MTQEPPALPARVLVVGSGLLGTSVGLALRRRGVDVRLEDADAAVLAVAESLGAGAAGRDATPADVALVAVPPSTTAEVVAGLLADGAARAVTDVASVKAGIAAAVGRRAGGAAARYVGSHPMAGRETHGPRAARSDLFEGRPWVLCPAPGADATAVELVEGLAAGTGASVVRMGAADHDAAVALVSQAPHVVASLVAGRLRDAPEEQVVLAGPGIADVTRVAAGDPALWREILTANAAAVRAVLEGVRADLEAVLTALGTPRDGGAALHRVLVSGAAGRSRLPGKHGGARTEFRVVPVVVADRPGQLGRLFGDCGEAGVNIEDLRVEHSPGQPVGLVEVAVRPERAGELAAALRARGWTVHDPPG